MKYINIPVFLISLILGFIFIHISAEPTETVFVYPTPENAGSLEYIDKANNCFVYKSTQVKCPSDENMASIR